MSTTIGGLVDIGRDLDDDDLIEIEGLIAGIPTSRKSAISRIVNKVTASLPAGGDVEGPASSTDGHLVQFDGATGKQIKDGGLELDTDGTLGANSDAKIASQKAVKTAIATAISNLIGTAPGVLDTLGEISDAINDDANLYTTLVAALALKAPLASPALTGTPTAPTATGGTNTTQIATTAFVQAAVAGGVSDGDKGDITVSGSGAVWALDNDVVTNAKAANMVQGTLKGRVTASTGDPEDLTYNQQRILLNKKQTLTSATTVTPDCDSGLNMRLVLAHNMTLANPTNLVDGDVINLRVKQDGTGSRLLSAVGSKWKFPSGTLPVLSTAANSVDFISGHYDSTDDTITAVCSKAFA